MRAQAVYRALLHCYPAAFRDEYGSQMFLMFTEQLGEARRTGGPLKQAAVWSQAACDAFTIAPKEHCHLIFKDLRYALRIIAAKPGFAAVAILSLALGIGANTAIFSLWNGLLHASLPAVDKPDELAILSNPGTAGAWHGNVTGTRDWLTYAEFEQLRDRASAFSGLMASQSGLLEWLARLPGGGWEQAHQRLVSGGYFQVLGVGPALGRVFTAEDDRAALPHAVISYDYWQRRFGGSVDVLGKTIAIATLKAFSAPMILPKASLTIIGVAPRGFIGETAGQQPDIWIPLRMQPVIMPSMDWLHESPPEKIMWLHVFGRLKPGISLARAEAESNTIFKAGLESFYGTVASVERRRELLDQRLKVQSGRRGASEIRGDFSTSLTALLAAVGLLLLIACANLANLLLARGAARQPEMALRLSLGASRSRLIRQLLTESLLLAGLGGLAGLAVAYFLHSALVQMIVQADENFRVSFALEPSVLVFTLAVTLAAALLFGILPAWQATKTDAGAALKEHGRGAAGGIGRMRWGRSLVSLQLALSVPLLVGAGLLARTLYNLQHVDLGYPAGHLLLVKIDLLGETVYGNARRSRLLRELLQQFQQIPGMRAASFSQLGVFSGGQSTSTIEVEGFVSKQSTNRESPVDRVGPNYFSALGIPIKLGREILERDQDGSPKVCVINQAFAERFFAGRNPIGLHITAIGEGAPSAAYQIVGVARNARTQNLRGEVEPRFFVAAEQDPLHSGPIFLLRTSTTPASLLAPVRQAVRRVDATLPIDSAESIEERMAPLTAQDRAIAQLAVVFGSVALTLAAIGLYGVLAYGIARRRGEIAIRIAVGAKPGRVIAMILSETSGVVLTGLVIGAGLAFAASRLVGSRLYAVAAHDPLTLALATMLLLLVGFSAAYLPRPEGVQARSNGCSAPGVGYPRFGGASSPA